MEFKKKTIIWEDNNEPPKDYIWVKSDGKAYEYSYSQRKWIESKSISGDNSGSSGGDGGSGGGGDSTEIDYEAIYQFYKKEFIKNIPEPVLPNIIIPEHLSDVQYGMDDNEEYIGKLGFWKAYYNSSIGEINGTILHTINLQSDSMEVVYFGLYGSGSGPGPDN